jgi:hypothetical protein
MTIFSFLIFSFENKKKLKRSYLERNRRIPEVLDLITFLSFKNIISSITKKKIRFDNNRRTKFY